ncbi:hypothetical protein TSMEX_009744 [Taenia solium]|eukprot:TsM_000997900 transcript=TsM_000997900 gene=TsM_000997900
MLQSHNFDDGRVERPKEIRTLPAGGKKTVLIWSRINAVALRSLGYLIRNYFSLATITGGNDGSLVFNQIEIPRPEEEVSILNDGLVSCVKPVTNAPKVKQPSSLAKHSFPSDTYFHHFPATISPVLRDVFIGSEGRIFTIFESGDISLLRSDNGKASELTPLRPCLSPTLSKRVFKEAEFVDKDGVHLIQDRLFPGYCVSGVHRASRRFALGGRWGCLGIYEIIDGIPLVSHCIAPQVMRRSALAAEAVDWDQ